MRSRLVIIVFLSGVLFAQNNKELDITPSQTWTDTGIDVQPGDTLKITATGSVEYQGKSGGPGGLSRGWMDMIRQLPFNDAGRGALVGRVGDETAARPFLIGPQADRTIPIAGRLFVGFNQMDGDPGTGKFHVIIQRTAAAKQAARNTSNVALPKFTQSMIDKIPIRVSDAQGNAGDRVNFIVIGSEDKVRTALDNAGWVQVDKSDKDAVVRGLLASLSKQAYVTMPMSTLQLFGRNQDYGYAQGDPLRVVASRHHFRLWKAPFTADGQTVWAGAGTHDIGFDRDQRNNKITHKIDPNTDAERDYIGQSFSQTGLVAKLDYITPSNPLRTAKTAHGEEFHSDGRTLLIYLQPDATSGAGVAFSDVFCTVLSQNNPDGGDWSTCDKYIDGGGKTNAKLPEIASKYRLLIVPGILNTCVGDTQAYFEGQQVLRDKYKMDVQYLKLPNDASEANAKAIADYVKRASADDKRKFIVLGYSKGAPDLHVALATYPDFANQVAAFVTVAGAIGGSPIADVLPSVADKYINKFKMGGCEGDLAAGFTSLKSSERHSFISSHPTVPVPSYSVAARSDQTSTSRSLLQTWRMLLSISKDEDGQLVRDDAIVPGGQFLGIALGDHFAVAMPFEKSTNAEFKAGMDKSHYPRAALLESIVRYVSADLESRQ